MGTTPADPPLVIPTVQSVTYLGARRLSITGPHGRVIGFPTVGSVHVELDGDHLTVSYTNAEQEGD